MGSATVPVAVFGVPPKTLQQTDLSNDGSGATPEPARGTRALPPIVHPKLNTGKECSSAECARLRSRHHCVTTRRVASTRQGVRNLEMGSATVPVAVFGVAPETLQQTNLSNDGSGATPEPARGTRALPPTIHPKLNTGKESSRAECARLRSRLHCVTTRRVASTRQGFEWGARPSRLPFLASRRKPFNQQICPTMVRARRPNPHAGRARSPPNRPS
jgi:hypothetical protein